MPWRKYFLCLPGYEQLRSSTFISLLTIPRIDVTAFNKNNSRYFPISFIQIRSIENRRRDATCIAITRIVIRSIISHESIGLATK